MSRLAEIKARAEAATQGPWSSDWSEGEVPVFYGQTTKISGTFSVEANTIEDAAFIAAAREDVPWLLAEVERLTAERDDMAWQRTQALNERDALAAQVARVEALASHWEYLMAKWSSEGKMLTWTRAAAISAQALRFTLAGSETDTTDTQPTDQEEQ